jgi:hypothetical protein
LNPANLDNAKDDIGTTLDIATALKKKEGIWQTSGAQQRLLPIHDMQGCFKFSVFFGLQNHRHPVVAGPMLSRAIRTFNRGIVFRTKADCAIVYIDLQPKNQGSCSCCPEKERSYPEGNSR